MNTENSDEDGLTDDSAPFQLAAAKKGLPPTRDHIDFIRGTWQVTPASINTCIDLHRSGFLAAGVNNEQIDEYYGIETFDADAAARVLSSDAAAADIGEPLPQGGPFPEITRNPDFLRAVGRSPNFYSSIAAQQSTPLMRGEIRRQLVESYRMGSCDTADRYRHRIMATLIGAESIAQKHVYGWLGEMLPGPAFEAAGRVMPDGIPVVDGLIRSSLAQETLCAGGMTTGAANVVASALFDHEMPDAKDFYNIGTIAQFVGSGGQLVGETEHGAAPAVLQADPESRRARRDAYFKAVGNVIKNTMDAYVDYNISPFLITARGLEHPGLFRELMSDTPDIRLFFPEETKFGPYGGISAVRDRGTEIAGDGPETNAPVPEGAIPDSEPEEEENSEYNSGIIGGGFTPQMWILKSKIDAEKAGQNVSKVPPVGSSPTGAGAAPGAQPGKATQPEETPGEILQPSAVQGATSTRQPNQSAGTKSRDSVAGNPDRLGLPFTKGGKRIVKELNRQKNQGVTKCETCGTITNPAKKHQKGITPPHDETHTDHVTARAKGGSGLPSNGQVLCRTCNLKKKDE